MTLFPTAAARLAGRGMAAHPLTLDPDGRPKMPMHPTAWLHFRPEHNLLHNWDAAKGIGVVLGANSGNLAVLDIDDAGLAEAIESHLMGLRNPPLMARTPRGHLHVFVTETTASVPVDIECRWQSRWAEVELLARTRQVAVAPTPGYAWIDDDAEPFYGTAGGIWHGIAEELNLNYRLARFASSRPAWSRRLP